MKHKTINLIPGDTRKARGLGLAGAFLNKHKLLRNGLVVVSLPLALTLAQAGYIAMLKLKVVSANDRARLAKIHINQMQSQALQLEKQKSDLLKEEAAKKQALDQLMSTSSGNKKYASILAKMEKLMPRDLWFNELLLTDSEVQIVGAAVNTDLIIQFTEQMDKSGFFKNSIFNSSEKQTVESHVIYNFKVSAEPVWAALEGETASPLPSKS